MGKQRQIGLYHPTTARNRGSVVWRNPAGEEVTLTIIIAESGVEQYLKSYPDAQNRGEVTEYVRGRMSLGRQQILL